MKKILFTFAAMLAITVASAQTEKTTSTTTQTKTVQPDGTILEPTVSTTTTVEKRKPETRKRTVGTKKRTVRTTTRTDAKPAVTTKTTKVVVPAQ